MNLRKITGVLLIGMCCIATAHAQDPPKPAEDGEVAGIEDEPVDSTAEKKVEVRNFNGKTRQTRWQEALWDNQKPGEWSEAAQNRLTIRKVPDASMEELRNMSALQYDKKAKKTNTPLWLKSMAEWVIAHRPWVRNFYYIMLGLIFIFTVLLFLRKSDFLLFRRSSRNAEEDEGYSTPEGPQNYEALAQAAMTAGDFREATRMRYLQSLHLLLSKELLTPGKDKTNMDFLRELSTTAFHKPFAALTRHYEYIWYGKVPLSSGQFMQLDEQFAAFKKSLR